MTDRPIRIQRQRTKGWKMPDGAVYVGRPTKWVSPFKVGAVCRGKRSSAGGYDEVFVVDADHAVRLFRRYAARWHQLQIDAGMELRGKSLACFCPLDRPCHADVLLEIANR